MNLDYWLGGILSVALAVYLVYALVRPEAVLEVDHDDVSWIQIGAFLLVILAITKPFGLYSFGFEGEARPLPRTLGRVNGCFCGFAG